MRMLLTVDMPHEPFNTHVREGNVGKVIGQILEDMKPESAYFTEQNGTRTGVFVINVENSSQIPTYAEPWFLRFNADCKFRIAMSPDDLSNAGLESLGKKWS